MLLTIIVFIITLLVLVLSHELGHFLAARKFDVKVLEFGFGLPPRAWGKKIGETIYSLNFLPIGGFVRLFGEDEVEKEVLDNPRSFAAKPVGQRIGIVVAGVMVNFLLAIVLFWVVLGAKGFKEEIPLLMPHDFVGVEQTNQTVVFVGEVAPDSPAEKAGIKPQDRIVQVNGENVASANELIEKTDQNLGKTMSLTLQNPQGEKRTVELTPRENPPEEQGAIGVRLGTVAIANLHYATPMQKAFAGIVHSYNLTDYSLKIFGGLVAASVAEKTTEPLSDTVAGPVGITTMAGSVLQLGLIPYLNFVALLSLNLAIINILPFPALDGGRLVFLLIEGIFRKKIKAEVERLVHTIGMALLIMLIILVTVSDIRKLL